MSQSRMSSYRKWSLHLLLRLYHWCPQCTDRWYLWRRNHVTENPVLSCSHFWWSPYSFGPWSFHSQVGLYLQSATTQRSSVFLFPNQLKLMYLYKFVYRSCAIKILVKEENSEREKKRRSKNLPSSPRLLFLLSSISISLVIHRDPCFLCGLGTTHLPKQK